ncbi:armadillo-type protein [Dipodascopsis tothii]|uniref:armadillo-type protein n=1 Tax=Dipodascopsis tothii TaxID=44089 RepID=UPI0034CFC5D4
MQDQVEQAVGIALDGSATQELKQQAIDFCNQIKDSPDGWQICLGLFIDARKSRSDASRFFALQVIDETLLHRSGQLNEQSARIIQDAMLQYAQRDYGPQSNSSVDIIYMRNKFAQSLTYLFLLSYHTTWPGFYNDLLTLTHGSGQFDSYRGVDLFLRVLLAQHEEIADTLIIRSSEMAKRNADIKDLIRVRDMTKLTEVWMNVLVHWSQLDEGNEITENCLKVISAWVSWIDITLIVTPRYMNLIFGLLSRKALRGAACDTLTEIISKKMKPSDKLQMISLLSLDQTISQLQLGNDIEFDEKVARLINVISCELTRIMEEDQLPPELKNQSEKILHNILPFVLKFLGNEYDDTSVEVFPAVSEYLTFLRREKKKSSELSQIRLSILSSLLQTVILKLKYDEQMEWTTNKDDSENDFIELRGKLRLFQDAVAHIDVNLFIESVATVVLTALSSESRDWRDIELGLYELGAYSDGLKNASALPVKGQQNVHAIERLNEMLLKMSTSKIISFNHPSIQLHFMELVVKNSKFYENNKDLIPAVLEVFVSPLGMYSGNPHVRVRAWFLFYRFIKLAKGAIGNIAETALSMIKDLLVIKAEVIIPNDADSEMSADAAAEAGSFDSQLYVFEVSGILISIDAVPDETQLNLTRALLAPIFEDMEKTIPVAKTNPQAALQIHHDIMAIGTFARGVKDGNKPIPRSVIQEFLNASKAVSVTLETLSTLEVIRDASRFAFARLVAVLDQNIIAEIPLFVSRLLTDSKNSELIDFMAFIGQLIHSFKNRPEIYNMVDELFTPLLNRVFYFLSLSTGGSTDAEIMQTDMKRSYLTFLFSVLNNGMETVLLSESNGSLFDSVLQSVAHYTSTTSDSTCTKLGNSIGMRLNQLRARSG